MSDQQLAVARPGRVAPAVHSAPGPKAHRLLYLLVAAAIAAQDPAHGWMAYAVGTMPANYERITKLEMTWTIGKEPSHSRAFFSPWYRATRSSTAPAAGPAAADAPAPTPPAATASAPVSTSLASRRFFTATRWLRLTPFARARPLLFHASFNKFKTTKKTSMKKSLETLVRYLYT